MRHRSDFASVAALALLGSLAFVHLMALPAFEDEGTQLRWIFRSIDANEWARSWGEGKPLEAWPMVPLAHLGLAPLAAIRGLHVVIGIVGAVLTYRLATLLDERATALASGTLFAICPFVVYLQRLALSEILLCTAGLWVLVAGVTFLESPSRGRAVQLAAALVLAACSKLPVGFVFLGSIPLALVLMPPDERRVWVHRPARTRLIAAHAPAALLALLIVVVAIVRLRRGLSPGFGVQDLLGIGAGRYAINLPRPNLLEELVTQLSWPVVVIGLIGVVASALLLDWRQRWLVAVGALPMIGIGVLARFWFPRYLLFTLPPLIVAAVYGWRAVALRTGRFRRPVEIGLLAACVGFMAPQSARLILDPATANWSRIDRYGYLEGPGSGYGYPEAAAYIATAPLVPPAIYALDGHSAYQLQTYLPPEWRSRIRPVIYADDGRLLSSTSARLDNLLHRTPVWIIVAVQLLQGYLDQDFGQAANAQLRLRQVAVFDKPGGRTQLGIYEVTLR